MGNIYVTGDKHGQYQDLMRRLKDMNTTKKDVVIVLGDHGTLYYGEKDDKHKKRFVNGLPATFIMLRGNHDRRASAPEYTTHELRYINTPEYEGNFWIDPEYPSILYTTDWGWYRFGTKKVFVICGAYSVDKYRRLQMTAMGFKNYHWFKDEQLSEQERQWATDEMLFNEPIGEFYIMSHTCPFKYRQLDHALPGIDLSKVDNAMEIWMNHLEAQIQYTKWYCGHWHVDLSVDKMRFMFHDLELFEEVTDESLS